MIQSESTNAGHEQLQTHTLDEWFIIVQSIMNTGFKPKVVRHGHFDPNDLNMDYRMCKIPMWEDKEYRWAIHCEYIEVGTFVQTPGSFLVQTSLSPDPQKSRIRQHPIEEHSR